MQCKTELSCVYLEQGSQCRRKDSKVRQEKSSQDTGRGGEQGKLQEQ